YDLMRRTMPLQKPEGVTDQEKIDILAYIFSANHFPAGSQELPADPVLLKQILFKKGDSAGTHAADTAAVKVSSNSADKSAPRTLAEAAKDANRTSEEEDALRAADVDTITPRPHVPAKYWIDLMPEDTNKQLVVNRCAFCHDMQRTLAFSRPK